MLNLLKKTNLQNLKVLIFFLVDQDLLISKFFIFWGTVVPKPIFFQVIMCL